MYDLLQLTQIRPIGMRDDGDKILIFAENIATPPDRCDKCGNAPLYKHGKRRYTYADTPIHGKPVKVEIETRRYRCKACGTVVTLSSPSLDDRRVATRRLVQYIQDRCFGTTFTWLANEVGLSLNTVKGITQDYAAHLEELVELETPRLLGLDELHILGKPRAVLVNLEMRSMFDMLESRTKVLLTNYFKNLKNRDRIKWVVIDMWKPYELVIGKQLPNARIVIDRFHVVKEASKKLDELRRHLQSKLSSEDRIKLKKHLRWSLLRNEPNRTEKDVENIEYIRNHYPELSMALTIKEEFFSIYDAPNRKEGEKAFQDWKDSIPKDFRKYYGPVASMVDRHHGDIFNYFDCPATNGYTEAMNGVMKAMNRLGRGYSFEILRARSLSYRVMRESGTIVTHTGETKDISKPVSTMGDRIEKSYGTPISTLESLAENDELIRKS
ncbi:ISL3 family transposase [Thiolapillus sp.]|uniref:ISL3 family transposase n=1 Tax=Thiolapillus sp. TaxID=2017437 RepID=UPI003AF48AA5